MDFFLRWLVGAIVWAFANVLYVDLRRKGTRRGRLLSFIAGYPGTLISFFTVKEGQVPRIEPPDDDEERLLEEIRVDRELRGVEGSRLPAKADVEAREGEPEGSPGN